MASMKYYDKHNQVGFLKKPEESAGFAEIVDFLKGSHIRYALTHNPTIHDSLVKQFWQTATASTLADGTLELRATIDTLEYTITEASVRSKLQLADASGISMLPNTEIFEGMGNMGYPTDGPADQAKDQPSSSEPLPSTSHPTPVEPKAPQSKYPSHPHVPEARSLTAEDLLHMVPTLITKVDSLEIELKQTKQTMGKAIVKSVKKVKKLENILKRRNVVLTTLEDEEPEDQGRIFKDIDDDPLVASQRSKSVDKGKRYKRRKEFKGKDFEDISTGFEEVNTGGLVNTCWEIQRKLKANAELTKNVLGKELPEEDFAKKMVELVNQRKKFFAEERAKAQEEGHEGFHTTKAQLKRYGEELQTEISKKQRIDDKDVSVEEKVTEVKEEEPVIRTGKRKEATKAKKEKRANGVITVYMAYRKLCFKASQGGLIESTVDLDLFKLAIVLQKAKQIQDFGPTSLDTHFNNRFFSHEPKLVKQVITIPRSTNHKLQRDPNTLFHDDLFPEKKFYLTAMILLRMEDLKKNSYGPMPYAMLLTRLFKHILQSNPQSIVPLDRFTFHERVINPLDISRKTIKAKGKRVTPPSSSSSSSSSDENEEPSFLEFYNELSENENVTNAQMEKRGMFMCLNRYRV
ncbi:hypothetical protein Tco_0857250 [Tanacetum coccineum]|uniref:Uncharacterized protein n=1 Tax=Tanacetum coccineum TaxID=301880 RepID=A0ABQ5B6S4_9ASTR